MDNKVHDYLTSIEEYLRGTLADENLSTTAQIKRRHLLDKFYALQLPPNVSRRSGSVSSASSSPARYRLAPNVSASCRTNGHDSKGHMSCDDVSNTNDFGDASQGVYEDPDLIVRQKDGGSGWSDDGGDTEYESYDDEDDRHTESLYINDMSCGPVADQKEVTLPRVRVKKKKTKNTTNESNAKNVTYSGNFYHKGMLSWTQRYCVISCSQLLCYRSEKDTKPVLMLPLPGRDVMYTERTDSRFIHAIRISRPGSETHWFYTDSRESADAWLMHLRAEALKVPPRSAVTRLDSDEPGVALRTDTESLVSNTSSGPDVQTNQSGGSSEGGSGDGIIQSAVDGKASNSRKAVSKIGESLHTLIGSLSKKKGDKIKKALADLSNMEAENAVLAGYVNISIDTTNAPKWTKRFCVVKRGRLDCYKDPLDDVIEFSMCLSGATLDLSDKRLRRDLALRVVHDGQDVFIEAFNTDDYARWLNMLLRETTRDLTNGNRDSVDGIYDEVYNWAVYQSVEQVSMAAPPPPPLPRYPPPKAPPLVEPVVQARDENDYIEPQMVFDNMFDDDGPLAGRDESLDLEEAVNSAFKHLREGFDRRSSPVRKTTSGNNSPATQRSAVATKTTGLTDSKTPSVGGVTRTTNKLQDKGTTKTQEIVGSKSRIQDSKVVSKAQEIANRGVNKVSDSGIKGSDSDLSVVKGHSGPTIAEDQELLQATQNPILSELRKGKEKKGGSGGSSSSIRDLVKIEEQLDELRQSYEDLKKKRSEIRGKLQTATTEARRTLEEQLQIVDRDMEQADRDIAKLSFLAPERDRVQLNRLDGVRRSLSSPRNSYVTDGGHRMPSFMPVTRNNSLRETTSTTSSSLLGRPSSSASSSPLSLRRGESLSSTATEKRSSFSGLASSSGSTVASNGNGVNTECRVTRVSSLTKPSLPSSSVRELHVGTKPGVTVTTGGTADKRASTLPARTSLLPMAAGSSIGSRSGDEMKSLDEESVAAAARKVVQERLKLWEARSENSFPS